MVPRVPPCSSLPFSATVAIQGLSCHSENVKWSENLFSMRSYTQGLSYESWASINKFGLSFMEEAKIQTHDENNGFSFEFSYSEWYFLWALFFLKYDVRHITISVEGDM